MNPSNGLWSPGLNDSTFFPKSRWMNRWNDKTLWIFMKNVRLMKIFEQEDHKFSSNILSYFAWLTIFNCYFIGSFFSCLAQDLNFILQNNVFTDCGFQFSSESEEDDPLRILKEGDEIAFIPRSKNCSINATSSMYLDCGKWLPIDEMSVLNKFSLKQRFMDSHVLKASHLKRLRHGNLTDFCSQLFWN